MKTTVIIAIIVTSIAFAIESQSAKTTRQIPTPKVEQRPCKGKKCSISTTAPYGGRIIGGYEALPNSWPWMAFILCQNDQQVGPKICGGTLISDRWIITAAHCLITKKDVLRDCKIWLGKHLLRTYEPTQLLSDVAFYQIHEKYKVGNAINGYDLGLVKLAQPVKFTDAIKPMSLPFGRPELPYNQSCIATGWGVTKFGNKEPSDKLMQLEMTLRQDLFCSSALGRPSDRVICAFTWDRNKDLCSGDSGGPLACKEADGLWYLRGVTSMMKDNCTLEAFFTKVTFFEDWIKNLMSRN